MLFYKYHFLVSLNRVYFLIRYQLHFYYTFEKKYELILVMINLCIFKVIILP